jgi:hypothetical protein
MEKKSVNKSNNPRNFDILGFLMVTFPLLTSILMWYIILLIDAVDNEYEFFWFMVAGTVFFTTVLATIDSHRLGIKIALYRKKEIYGGSFLKFFVFLFLWPYAYPVYLYRRKYYGSRSLIYPLAFSILIFAFSSFYLQMAIDAKKTLEDSIQRRKIYHRTR